MEGSKVRQGALGDCADLINAGYFGHESSPRCRTQKAGTLRLGSTKNGITLAVPQRAGVAAGAGRAKVMQDWGAAKPHGRAHCEPRCEPTAVIEKITQ